MEAFSALLALCARNSSVTNEFPSQRASNVDFNVPLIQVHMSCLTNIQMAGDLGLHDVHVTSS